MLLYNPIYKLTFSYSPSTLYQCCHLLTTGTSFQSDSSVDVACLTNVCIITTSTTGGGSGGDDDDDDYYYYYYDIAHEVQTHRKIHSKNHIKQVYELKC